MPKPRTTELPFAGARLVIFGAGREATGAGAGWGSATVGAGGAGGGGVGTGGGGGGGRTTAAGSLTALAPFFFAGCFPFPWRTGGASAGTSPFANVSFTSATSASDMNGFSIVATTFLYFRAVAAISPTCPDIITTGTRDVASFCNSRSQTWSPRKSGRL